jgi:hypothetical protein
MRNPWSVPRLMFPSRGSASTRAAFAPLGPGAILRSPPSSLVCGPPTPLPLQHASGLPSVMPYPLGKRPFLCSSMVPSRGRPPVRLLPTARRRGSPVLRCPDPPTGRTGVSQVTGSSSSAVPQSTTPPVPRRLASIASGSAAFRDRDTLSTRDLRISGLLSCGPPARLTTLQPCPHGRRLQAWLPACWLGFDWVGIAPTGRLVRVLVYIPTSSLTGIAWSLPRSAVLRILSCRDLPSRIDSKSTVTDSTKRQYLPLPCPLPSSSKPRSPHRSPVSLGEDEMLCMPVHLFSTLVALFVDGTFRQRPL